MIVNQDAIDQSTDLSNHFAHYGVKGMKWGVRRKLEKKASESGYVKKSEARKMSNEDLSAAVKRMNLEKQYITLSSERTTTRGQQYMRQYEKQLGNLAVTAAATGTAALVKRYIWPLVKKRLNL